MISEKIRHYMNQRFSEKKQSLLLSIKSLYRRRIINQLRSAKKIIYNRPVFTIAASISILLNLSILVFMALPVSNETLRGKSSLLLLSEEGIPIRIFRDRESGAYSEWMPLEEYPEKLIDVVIRAEDKRFYYHFGVDPVAVLRSFYLNIKNLRIVSGASTISQQMVRIAYADSIPDNALLRKLYEVIYSVKLELYFSKDDILEAYINRVPLKYNRMGMAAASREIFSKSPEFLSTEESIALAVLIRQSRVSKNIFKKRFLYLRSLTGQSQTLDREAENQIIASVFKSSAGSKEETLTLQNEKSPHFTEWMSGNFKSMSGRIQTHISSRLSDEILSILNRELMTLEYNRAGNGAVVVLEIADNQNLFNSQKSLLLKAMIGSRDFQSEDAGQVNGALALRNAGSTLKPFIYALSMEKLGLRPYSILDDSKISLAGREGGMYQPKNYDLNYWGKITLREALATSRNIPAVKLLNDSGIEEFYKLLKKMNVDHMMHSPEYYGPGMALGSAGLSLLELTRLYSVFPAHGTLLPLEIGHDESDKKIVFGSENKIFPEEFAYKITHILADQDVRRKAFGNRSFLDFPYDVAAKTGTSKDYRDSWTVGYTSKYIVGVWVGNFSGDTMQSISGVFGAGRIFQLVMRILEKEKRNRFLYPDDWKTISICRISGHKAKDNCPAYSEIFTGEEKIPEDCGGNHTGADEEYYAASQNNSYDDAHFIQSPQNGEVYLLDPHSPDDIQGIPLEIKFPDANEYEYAVNGKKMNPARSEIKQFLKLKEGMHKIEIFRYNEMVESVEFEVKNQTGIKK